MKNKKDINKVHTIKNKKDINKVHTIKNKNQYHKVEDLNIDKSLSFSFKFLFSITMALNLIIFFYSKDICNEVRIARCSIFYYTYKSQSFFILMWIENVMAIILGFYDIFLGIMDKKYLKILKDICFVLIQPVVWFNLFIFLNISW